MRLATGLVSLGSLASIGFGVWHLFVPRAWNWYSYIDPAATELLLAVRATNFFFSLSLILFGLMGLLFFHGGAGDFAKMILLGCLSILWLARLILQILAPQGSMNPALQYGMLAAFAVQFLCFALALVLVLARLKS